MLMQVGPRSAGLFARGKRAICLMRSCARICASRLGRDTPDGVADIALDEKRTFGILGQSRRRVLQDFLVTRERACTGCTNIEIPGFMVCHWSPKKSQRCSLSVRQWLISRLYGAGTAMRRQQNQHTVLKQTQ
jgi:hypothetical protein